MRILGLLSQFWISSAALLKDGAIVAGAAEERFNREKMSRKFPHAAIDYCLKEDGSTIEDVDYIAVGWNPGVHLQSYNRRFSDTFRWHAEFLYNIPNSIFRHRADKRVPWVEQIFKHPKGETKIIYVTHHLAHAANGFYLSPYKEAAIFTADGRGEDETTFFGTGKNNKITEIKTIAHPQSIGNFYSTVTQFLGFDPHSDEWKVMALASYGSRNNAYYKKFKKILKLLPDGTFELDLSYFDYYLHDKPRFYSPKFVELFGNPRASDAPMQKQHYDIAAALQQITEETLSHMLTWLHKKTKQKNLVVNGGVFMNSVFNGKILKLSPFKNVFISSCPDDSGIAIGAAAYVHHDILKLPRMKPQEHNYWGPEYSDTEIKDAISKYKLTATHVPDIEKHTASLLSGGKIVGWFQGKMEFGQRALGNRSILADPRREKMKDLVNRSVKYREGFRPFAPSVLEEKVSQYFECGPKDRVPFMERVYLIRPQKRSIIPAVTHVDGTGRLQTVSKKYNPRYHKLISEFEKLTGVPVVLNTSFNLKGEPVVMTPTDAIRTFVSSGLDALVMGSYVLTKGA
ncbi:MAG: carbamoyltransferase C-terminal domain-containing protein [Minisyncoccia bacterium]